MGFEGVPADWLWGLVGGLMIGGAAALYLLGAGRIMGASGIVGSLVDGSAGPAWVERGAFVAALVAVPGVLALSAGGGETGLTPNLGLVAFAGLAVGLGTRMANGCTSGHGVCGISRLSRRGIVATLVSLLAGGVSVLVARHLLGVV